MARVAERRRLDLRLVERGLAATREKAQALIMAGRVRVGDATVTKAGTQVAAEAAIAVDPGPEHVGRGALKLAAALDAFQVDPAGRTAIDVGASTGGFTEILLSRGAARVFAVDVGRAQLHERLRVDERVVVLEEVNARALTPAIVPERCSLAVIDVSFISVLKILPALRNVVTEDADVVSLVKPQFEVGRAQVGKGGIVRAPALHRQAVADVARGAAALGFAVRAVCPSPISGAEGNREFFLHLRPSGPGLSTDTLEAMIATATG
jgi:23S rRNA (cytidine1920-2'-O)/16S rRNA (cytidine1409-2'-O)-methyltransferase